MNAPLLVCLALVCGLSAGGALGQAKAPESSPAPPARPDVGASESIPSTIPDRAPAPTDPEPAEDPGEASGADRPALRETLRASEAEFASCLARLDEYGTVYTAAEAILDAQDRDCGIDRPVRIDQIVPGVAMQPETILRCEMAARLAEWVAGTVIPAAILARRGAVTAIDHGSSYICRRRNNLPDGMLSEHSFGNALDVTGFSFADGAPIRLEPRADSGTIEEAFQRAVRGGACLSFTTVLGPGSDAAHADHLHLDIRQRNGGHRICQ